MTADVVICAEGLGKKYVIGHEAQPERYVALRDVLARTTYNAWRTTLDLLHGRPIIAGDSIEEFWALKDINFEIRRGEVVGIIGRNGAGKTTLLKILSRITDPTEGCVTVEGRVASLLEVGTGFHPELTGRENIYLNGTILGMTRAEIKRKFDEIVAFAEVERFLDTPVKRYSSGMYVRLAFAVAAHLEPEILIVDEVLAVGDIDFQRKCLGKMSEVAGRGRTVLFVSHNMAAIQALCPQSIFLALGRLAGHGATDEITSAYLQNRQLLTLQENRRAIKIQNGLVLEEFRLNAVALRSGDPLNIGVVLSAQKPGRIVECAITIHSSMGPRVSVIDTREAGTVPARFTEGRLVINVHINALPFVENKYMLGLVLMTDDFSGEFSELAEFSVVAARSSSDYAPYPAESRGVMVLPATTSVTFDAEYSDTRRSDRTARVPG